MTLHGLQQRPPADGPVLVTGGAGFIGSNLCRALLAQGREVYAVDNFITGRPENLTELLQSPLFHFVEIDITDQRFRKRFLTIPFREIYHLACPTGVPNISLLPLEMLLTCSLGTFHVLDIARVQRSSVLFTSSCEVYGDPLVTPQTTDYNGNVSPIGPRSPYEEGKRFGEAVIVAYARKFHVDAKIVRIFNTYGPGMSPADQRVIPRFLDNVRRGAPLVVYGDGAQTRTFLYVDDAVRAFQLVMAQGETAGVYNVGGTDEITMLRLAHMVCGLTGHTAGMVHEPHFTEDHRSRQPAIDALLGLGWMQEITLEDGLRRMIDAAGLPRRQSVLRLPEMEEATMAMQQVTISV